MLPLSHTVNSSMERMTGSCMMSENECSRLLTHGADPCCTGSPTHSLLRTIVVERSCRKYVTNAAGDHVLHGEATGRGYLSSHDTPMFEET